MVDAMVSAQSQHRQSGAQCGPQTQMLAFSLSGSSVISIVTFDYPDGYCYTLLPDDRCYRARSRIAAATEHSNADNLRLFSVEFLVSIPQ